MPGIIWQQCIDRLQDELPSQQFNTWIRPLQATEQGEQIHLYAPNRFIKDFVADKFSNRINELLEELQGSGSPGVVLEIGNGAVSTSVQNGSSPANMPPAVSGNAVAGNGSLQSMDG